MKIKFKGRRRYIIIYSMISPLTWIFTILIAGMNHAVHSFTFILVCVVMMVGSLLGSLFCILDATGEEWFTTEEDLNKKIDDYIEAKTRYIKLIENYKP